MYEDLGRTSPVNERYRNEYSTENTEMEKDKLHPLMS